MTYQIHSIASRGDQADVADSVKRAELVKGQALVHKVDRHKLNRAKAPIDAPDKLVDGRAKVLVLFHVLPRWNGELHQNNLKETRVNTG